MRKKSQLLYLLVMTAADRMEGKNPWARKEGVAEEKPKSPRDQFADAVEQRFQRQKVSGETSDVDAATMVFLSYLLSYPYAEQHEQFSVTENGYLEFSADEDGPDITILSWSHGSGPNGECTSDDVRASAKKLQETFPQILFDFQEDRQRKTFS